MTAISHIMLELAREPDHPLGSRDHNYHLYLPLSTDGRVDTVAMAEHEARCRVRRFRPGETERRGRIRASQRGGWLLSFVGNGGMSELSFPQGAGAFVAGEHVSIREEDGRTHSFEVICVRHE